MKMINDQYHAYDNNQDEEGHDGEDHTDITIMIIKMVEKSRMLTTNTTRL